MRSSIAGIAVLAGLALASPQAASAAPFAPWDGTNPFDCQLQDVGTGTNFPDPGADPFCVKFDKTEQNFTDGGMVDFLTKEPARVAAASPKCRYYQTDHWTGWIVQDQTPELYNFEGSYFFDKGRAAGGVFIKNFRVGGQSFDPTTLPGFPAEFKPYFSNGGGGAMMSLSSGDSSCPTSAQDDYYGSGGKAGKRGKGSKKCAKVGGSVSKRGIGKAKLGDRKKGVEKAVGDPTKDSGGVLRFCTKPRGGRLTVGFDGKRSAYVGTDVEKTELEGVSPGDNLKAAKKKLNGEKKRGKLLEIDEGKVVLVLATRGKTVESVGVADAGLSSKLLKKFANEAG
jgi:hypothetical protein